MFFWEYREYRERWERGDERWKHLVVFTFEQHTARRFSGLLFYSLYSTQMSTNEGGSVSALQGGWSLKGASRLLHEKFESYTAFNHVFPERNGFLLKIVRCSIVTLSEFSATTQLA